MGLATFLVVDDDDEAGHGRLEPAHFDSREVSRSVVSKHRAVVHVEVDGRLVCVGRVDGDVDAVPLEKNASALSIDVVRQDRDIVEVSMIDVHGDRKCVRVDKKRVQVDVESVPVSRDDGPEPIDDDRHCRNSFSVSVGRVSADMSGISAHRIVVDQLLNDVDVDRDVVDALRDRVQVELDAVQVDRDVDDGFENGGHPSRNRVFPGSDENSPSTIAVPVDRDFVDGFRDALPGLPMSNRGRRDAVLVDRDGGEVDSHDAFVSSVAGDEIGDARSGSTIQVPAAWPVPDPDPHPDPDCGSACG